MNSLKKIIIFDGSFKTTTFINRLVNGLVNEYDVYIMGFNEQLNYKVPKVHYVPLGSNQNYFRLAYVSLKYAFKTKELKRINKAFRQLVQRDRKGLQEQNLAVVLSNIQPDLIHLQWLSNIQLFEKHIAANTYKFILSQRGFHVNIRPFVSSENFKYLQEWYPKIDGFHSVSNAIKLVSEKIHASANKIDHVVYTGIDFEKLPSNKSLPTTKTLEIISVGRAHWIKGYNNALQSCQLLKEQNIDFKYTIIGAAGDEELQFLRHDYGLQNEVELLGRMPQKDVFECMQNAHVLVVSSIAEGVPNVVVEAMGLGVPVISTACGGVEELIENNTNGWLVPTRNPKALAEALIKFNQLPKTTIEEIRTTARKKVEAQHSETKMIADMENLYKTVIKAKS